MSYKHKEDQSAFNNWLNKVVLKSLEEGIVGLEEIKNLCSDVSEAAYKEGYKHGKNDGYLEAVKDFENDLE